MNVQEHFSSVGESFYTYGVENSLVDDVVSSDDVASWFEDVQLEDGDIAYWIHEPFMFAVVSWETQDTVEYTLFTPEYSDDERQFLADVESGEYTTIETEEDCQTVIELIQDRCGSSDVIDPVKVLASVVQQQSQYKHLYPFAEDDNVTEVNVYEGEEILVTVCEPTFQKETVTNVSLDSYPAFVEVWNSLEEQVDSKPGSHFKSGIIGTESKFTLAKSDMGRAIHIEFYDAQRVSVSELISSGFMDSRVGAYLWLLVESKQNMLVSGPSDAGKTTLLRALLDLTPPNSQIASVGDGKEMIVGQSHTQHYSREEFNSSNEELKSITGMLPSYLVVDNVQDEAELSVLMDSMREGKTVWASTYAGSVDATVHRLVRDPLNVPETQVQLFDVLVQLNSVRREDNDKSSTVRRVDTVGEIQRQENGFRITEAFHRDGVQDEFVEDIEDSTILEQIRYDRGWSHEELGVAISERQEILEVLCEASLFDSTLVREVVRLYNQDEEQFFQAMTDGVEAFESFVRENVTE